MEIIISSQGFPKTQTKKNISTMSSHTRLADGFLALLPVSGKFQEKLKCSGRTRKFGENNARNLENIISSNVWAV